MPTEIRRPLLNIQTTFEEGGKTVATPAKLVSSIAIIKNPWFGRGYVEDLNRKFARPVRKSANC